MARAYAAPVGDGRLRRGVVISVALIAVAGAVLASRSGRADVDGPPDPTEDLVDLRPDVDDASRRVSLTAPMDGKDSRLLPVLAEPSTGLTDGQTIAISGSGFTPRVTLGAVLCSAGAAGGGGVGFCELAHYDNFEVSAEGTFADDYVLRRFIVTPNEGRVDCAESTDRCILGVGNISDYDESGGSFVSFAGAPSPPPPSLDVTPTTGLVDGQALNVRGTGVRAAPDGWLRQCPADDLDAASCRRLDAVPVGPPVGGQLAVTVSVTRLLDDIDCSVAPGCVLATTEYAGRLATVPLEFLDPEPGTTAPTTTSTTAPSTTTTSTTSPPVSSTTGDGGTPTSSRRPG